MHVKQSEFITQLISRKLPREQWRERTRWEVYEPLIFNSKHLQLTIVVPVGFVTDYASIPRLILTTFLFGDRGHAGATVHDYLYRVGKIGKLAIKRRSADYVLWEAVQTTPDLEPRIVAEALWSGVRCGGWYPWRKYRKLTPSMVHTLKS